MRGLCIAVSLCAALAAAGAASAHTRSQSYSTWIRAGSELRVVFTATARDLAQLPGEEGEAWSERLAARLGGELHAWSGARPCDAVGAARALDASPGSARAELRLRCGAEGALRIRIDALFDAIPSHVHFARVRGDGRAAAEHLLTEASRVIDLSVDGTGERGTSLAGYLTLGVEHIAGGFDHLAFLVGLFLLCSGLRELLWVASGFTLGHSITLALAVAGWIRPEAAWVEALIGFTIAWVSVEAVVRRAGGARALAAVAMPALALFALRSLARGDPAAALVFAGLSLFAPSHLLLCESPDRARALRPALSLAFGSIHGLGFASNLLAVGVPGDRIFGALLGFNLGVELGQVAALASVWAASAWLSRRSSDSARAWVADAIPAALCALGVFWFASRAHG